MSVYLMTLEQLADAIACHDASETEYRNAWNERVSALATIERELQSENAWKD